MASKVEAGSLSGAARRHLSRCKVVPVAFEGGATRANTGHIGRYSSGLVQRVLVLPRFLGGSCNSSYVTPFLRATVAMGVGTVHDMRLTVNNLGMSVALLASIS